MLALKFKAVMKIRDGNPYIAISPTRATRLQKGWRKPMPVLIRINGEPKTAWSINMMPDGKNGFYLYLHGAVRKASKTKVGDRVNVEVAFDPKYRSGPAHPMPAWFSRPLKKNSQAWAAWQALIPSRKKEILRYFSWLKSDAARERNLEKAMHVLSGKPGRFMARAWKNGT